MRLLICSLGLAFLSINCFAQTECGQLSKKEIADLKITLQKAEVQEDNPYFLSLYKEIYLDSAVRIYGYEGKAANSITVGKKIQDILKHNESYDEIWFYTRGKRGYKVIANSGFSNYVALYPALGYQSKILNKIAKTTNLQEACILHVPTLGWFIYKNNQLFILRGKKLKNADVYFKRKYTVDQLKRILHPINGTQFKR